MTIDSAVSPIIREKAPLIRAEIEKARSILLHCHPSPDPDSVGSALAMKLALEQMGKKATVIQGDSEIPQAFMHFPGADSIVKKDFFAVDASDYDLFLALDTADVRRVSQKGDVVFPPSMKVVNIDHHRTNTDFGAVNLVEPSYPSTTQILFDLFSIWGIRLTPDLASDLFIGIYTDTGGFKFEQTTQRTFEVAGELIKHIPDFSRLISDMENSNSPVSIAFQALALDSVETFLGGRLAMAALPHAALKAKGIPDVEASPSWISSILRTVIGWDIDACLIENEAGRVKVSLRTRDGMKYDVSRLAVAIGGGGHAAASGALLDMPLEEAKKLVVAKAKELYNL